MERVFDLVLETTTKNILNWLMSEVDLPFHAYGMKTEEKSPEGLYYDKMFYIGNRRIVPPSSEWPHTCYVADGYLLSTATFAFPRVRSEKKPQFDEIKPDLDTAKDVEELGPVVRIEVREISENRTEVIGWCGDYAHLRPSMEDLRSVISEIFLLARNRSMTSQLGDGDSSYELNDLQKAIIEAVEQLNEQMEPWEPITDDAVSAKLSSMGIVNPKGNAYTREWIGKKRRKLQERGYDVGKKEK